MDKAPFFFGAEAATSKPVLMVSLFPESKAATGLVDTAKSIEIEAKASALAGLDAFLAPGRPAAAADLKVPSWIVVDGSVKVSAGLFAAAAVVASLY